MDKYFDLLLTTKEKKDGVKSLFFSYISNCDTKSIPLAFHDIFGYDYSLFFDDNYVKNLFDLLRLYYKNDYYVRHSFVKTVLKNKKNTTFFEMPINDSRADIVEIGKNSTVYEIKTNYDTLERLDKQINDYSSSFDFIYIICPKTKLYVIKEKIPPYCGIYYYEEDSKRDRYVRYRKAALTNSIKPVTQANICKLPYQENSNLIDTNFISNAFKKYLSSKYDKNSLSIKSFVNSYL